MVDYTELRTSLTWTPEPVEHIAQKAFTSSKRDVKKISERDASQSLPAAEDTELYGIQADIWSAGLLASNQLKDQFSADTQKVADSLNVSCDVEPATYESDEKTMKECNSIMRGQRSDILGLNRAKIRRTTALKHFQVKHEISRPADYPISQFYNIALILAALTLETIVNGAMFSNVADGLIGGIGRAVIFSVINVLLGGVLGFFALRYVFHINPVFKVIAGLTSLVLACLGVAWNLFVAHYRELAVDATGIDELDALAHMRENPFDLGSAEALGLFFFGLLIFGLMVYKGYGGLSDKYPGYARRDHLKEEATDNYDAAVEGLREEIEEVFIAEKERLEERMEEDKIKADMSEANVSSLSTRRGKIISEIDKVLSQGNSLLSVYRDTNRKIRSGVSVAHFAKQLDKDAVGITDVEIALTIGGVVKQAKKIRSQATKNEKTYRKYLGENFAHEESMMLSVDEYLGEINSEAAKLEGTGEDLKSEHESPED